MKPLPNRVLRQRLTLPAPGVVALSDKMLSTQAGFGKIMDEIARAGGPLADRIGFRSTLSYAEHIEHPDWTVLAQRPANLLQLSLLVHIRNAPASTAPGTETGG